MDANTLKYIADDLWHELNGIELCYPQVLDDADYKRIKAGFVRGSYITSNQDELERLYVELIGCLSSISIKPTNIVSLTARIEKAKRLADYLPKTFKDFVDKVTEARLQAEFYENAYEGCAEALFMQEIAGGMNAVVPRHREEVKGRVYEILMDHADEDEAVEVQRAHMDKILELMAIKDEIDLLTRCIDENLTAISNVIIFVREEIRQEVREDSQDLAELRVKLKSASTGEIEALDKGLRKLLTAVSQTPTEYGRPAERAKARRMEFASRIIMPRLKMAKDKRMSVAEAFKLGFSAQEAKVLLLLGYLKSFKESDQLKYHDPAAQDPETGRTIQEIEREAVAHLSGPIRPRLDDN